MAKNKARSRRGLASAKKVFVGLSGGVDSAVSAALLQKDGYDVTGVFIKVWTPNFLPCTWREDRRDAMRVCAHLGIPFRTLDLEKEYKRDVVDYMIREYKAGRTPNPDVMCNKVIKFGAFYDYAAKQRASFVATGHYAQIKRLQANSYKLQAATDAAKEQSYFLWNIKKEQLPHILFPVGGMQKSHVRVLAKKFKLPNAEKKDSQGLCFLGKVDMKGFLKHFIQEKKGSVLDVNDKRIGTHDGIMFLTIGQRHGFVVKNKKDASVPLYIVSKNIKKNTIMVSSHVSKGVHDTKVGKKTCTLTNTNWLIEPKADKTYDIRFRYHQTPLKGKLRGLTLSGKHGTPCSIILEKPYAGISPGQSAVIYDKETLIGGGVIES